MRFLLLHRMILRELVLSFLLSLFGFTLIAILAASFKMMREDLPAEYLWDFLPCLVPSLLVHTLPMSCLFATTLTYSRLSSDQEIQAAQWSGVRLGTCAAPALLMGAAASLACALLNDQVLPRATARFQRLQEEAARRLPLILAATAEPVFGTPTQKMYINGFHGDVFSGVTVMETKGQVTERILNAAEAEVHYDLTSKSMTFDLRGGSLEIFDPGPPPRVTQQATFEHYPLKVAFDQEIEVWRDWKAATRREIREALRRRLSGAGVDTGDPTYTIGDRRLYLGSLREEAVEDAVLLATLADGTHHAYRSRTARLAILPEEDRLQLEMGPGTDQRLLEMIAPRKILSETPYDRHVESFPLETVALGLPAGAHPTTEGVRAVLKARVLDAQQIWYRAKVELQERMSSALAALCFVAVGVPLGVRLRHGNRLVSFGVSLLVVFCVYYPAMVAGKELSLSGRLPAGVGLWMPDLLMLGTGGVLVRLLRV